MTWTPRRTQRWTNPSTCRPPACPPVILQKIPGPGCWNHGEVMADPERGSGHTHGERVSHKYLIHLPRPPAAPASPTRSSPPCSERRWGNPGPHASFLRLSGPSRSHQRAHSRLPLGTGRGLPAVGVQSRVQAPPGPERRHSPRHLHSSSYFWHRRLFSKTSCSEKLAEKPVPKTDERAHPGSPSPGQESVPCVGPKPRARVPTPVPSPARPSPSGSHLTSQGPARPQVGSLTADGEAAVSAQAPPSPSRPPFPGHCAQALEVVSIIVRSSHGGTSAPAG